MNIQNADLLKTHLQKARERESGYLNEAEVYSFLDAAGLKVPFFYYLSRCTEVEGDYALEDFLNDCRSDHIFLKVTGDQILHKSLLGGVKKVPCELDRVREELRALKESFSQAGILEQVSGFLLCEKVDYQGGLGYEILVSCRHDRAFGTILSLGIGGVHTEQVSKWLKDEIALVHLSPRDPNWRAKLDGIPAVQLNFRNTHPDRKLSRQSLEKFCEGLMNLCEFFHPQKDSEVWIDEIELNPVVSSHGSLIPLDGILRVGGEPQFPVISSSKKPNLNALLYPKSILVLGASRKRKNPGRVILDNLLGSKKLQNARILVAHREEWKEGNVQWIPDLDQLDEIVDLAIISLPAHGHDGGSPAYDAIKALVERGRAHSMILIPGGFGETSQGAQIELEIKKLLFNARANSKVAPCLNGGNCLGIISLPSGLNTFFIPRDRLPLGPASFGGLAWISQSGAFLVSALTRMNGKVAPCYSISVGNQTDLSIADYHEFLASHKEVNVLGLYIEGLKEGDGVRLLNSIRESSKLGKRTVIFKGGRTVRGGATVATHTASIAGEYSVFQALLRDAGAILADSLDQFEDLAYLSCCLSSFSTPLQKVFLYSNAGFECAVGADVLGSLELAELNTESMDSLCSLLPEGIVDGGNPMDVTPSQDSQRVLAQLEILDRNNQWDSLLVSLVPNTPALDMDTMGSFLRGLAEFVKASTRPVIVVLDSGSLFDPGAKFLAEHAVPVFRRIDRALSSLDALNQQFYL